MSIRRKHRASTLSEVLISMTVLTVVLGATISATISLQRTFAGSTHYAQGLGYQSRIVDYVLRDIRRATKVLNAGMPLRLEIPDYYQRDGSGDLVYTDSGEPIPVTPTLTSGPSFRQVTYGGVRTIEYAQLGNQLIRYDNGEPMILATDVLDFDPKIERIDRTFYVTIKFRPRFRLLSPGGSEAGSIKDGTAIRATALLRNVR